MSLADVYCRFNRARGMEVSTCIIILLYIILYLAIELPICIIMQLVSPDDVVNACKLFESLGLPLR